MARANLENLSDPDEIALAWSKFLVEDLIEHREAKTRAISPLVFTFELDDEIPCLPTLGESFDPKVQETARNLVQRNLKTYAYLAVLPGLPILNSQEGSPGSQTGSNLILGIPPEIIEPGEYPWFLMAVFVSYSQSMTFCGAFDGDKFSQVKLIHGSYGGFLANLLPPSH